MTCEINVKILSFMNNDIHWNTMGHHYPKFWNLIWIIIQDIWRVLSLWKAIIQQQNRWLPENGAPKDTAIPTSLAWIRLPYTNEVRRMNSPSTNNEDRTFFRWSLWSSLVGQSETFFNFSSRIPRVQRIRVIFNPIEEVETMYTVVHCVIPLTRLMFILVYWAPRCFGTHYWCWFEWIRRHSFCRLLSWAGAIIWLSSQSA